MKKMDKKRILPINEKPSVITCIHHAYPCAIIESKELVRIQVDSYKEYQWNLYSENSSIVLEDELVSVLKQRSKRNADAVLWRECGIRDSIVIKVDYIKNIDNGRYIDIFCFDNSFKDEIILQDKSYGFRWNPYGFFVKKEMFFLDTKAYVYLKIEVEDYVMKGFASVDGINWELLREVNIGEVCKSGAPHIGIHMHMGKDFFDMWKNMNYIQLLYNDSNPNKGIYLDYHFFPRKNVDNGYSSYIGFLESKYEVLYDMLDCFESIQEFVKWSIMHNQYVEICFDEYYVRDRKSYQKEHYNHYNLIYGYDDSQRSYYIMGYGANSTPVVSTLPYDDFTLDIVTSEKLIIFKYEASCISDIDFSIKAVVQGLHELLYDIDSNAKNANIMTPEKLDFGLSILKRLASEEKNKIIYDKRVAFCIMEHCRLMQSRIEFLYEEEYLDENSYPELKAICDQMVLKSECLLNQVLKNMLRRINFDIIKQSLLDLYDLETTFCEKALLGIKQTDPDAFDILDKH